MGRGFSLASLPTPRPNQNGRDRSHARYRSMQFASRHTCGVAAHLLSAPRSWRPAVARRDRPQARRLAVVVQGQSDRRCRAPSPARRGH